MLRDGDVVLRAVNNSDADKLYEAINSPDTARFNAPYKPIHEVNHKEWLSNILNDKAKVYFMIEHFGDAIGSIQLLDVNQTHRNAELAVRIFDDEMRGKGFGSRAIDLICKYSFNDLGLIRVWLRVFANNQRAINAYKKNGFAEEGVMKKAAFINGKFLDVVVMAIINE